MKVALNIVRKYYPNVVEVIDAKQGIDITVEQQDAKAGSKKDATNCALAKACKRQKIADGAIIGIGTSYLIKNDVAIRFKTSEAVAREITSFDRHQDFAAGRNYLLAAMPPAARLGAKHRGGKATGIRGPKKRHLHKTAFIRKVG